MNRTVLQSVFVVVAVGLVTTLFFLPKFVVSNEKSQLEEKNTNNSVTENTAPSTNDSQAMHKSVGSPEEQEKIKKWTSNYNSFPSKEKRLIFADSLAEIYTRLFEYDSAAKYFEQLAILENSDKNKLKAGLGIYRAFKVTMNVKSRKEMGQKALGYFDDLLATRPDWTDLKVKKAVIKVYTETPPMGGINMLKEIIAENPNHVEARITLGEFMLTVQKVEKAIEQFEAVVSVNPENEKALLYLVDSYQSVKNTTKAIKYLDQLEALDVQDEYIKSVIEKNRKELN
ncbi:MAG: tetratricopeptide repeat protein [Cytophagales bacterium]|nr:tetratricopeptide repeat protein [Cytophagales bacterium]